MRQLVLLLLIRGQGFDGEKEGEREPRDGGRLLACRTATCMHGYIFHAISWVCPRASGARCNPCGREEASDTAEVDDDG
jgi:hypothetical protein